VSYRDSSDDEVCNFCSPDFSSEQTTPELHRLSDEPLVFNGVTAHFVFEGAQIE
jgi:hypothetical protein